MITNGLKKLGQGGDTLVEITIALAILSIVLLSSFNLASFSFRLGQAAKERTQAGQLAQEQAEALRSFRDNTAWAAFDSGAAGIFHFENSGSAWIRMAGTYQPPLNGQPAPFTVSIERLPDVVIAAGLPVISTNSYLVSAKWTPVGGQACPLVGGVQECKTEFITNLGQLDDLKPVEN